MWLLIWNIEPFFLTTPKLEIQRIMYKLRMQFKDVVDLHDLYVLNTSFHTEQSGLPEYQL